MGQTGTSAITCGLGDKDVSHHQTLKPPKESTNSFRQKYKFTKKNNQYKVDHENLIKISNSNFVRSNYNPDLKVFEEIVGKNLTEIILEKRKILQANPNNRKQAEFSEYQILGLLESLIYSLAYLTHKNIPHHNFYPTVIFQAADSTSRPNYKIINPQLIQSSAYTMTLLRKRFSFLSTELIIAALNEKQQDEISPFQMIKSDIFAIGMIILQCGSMLPSAQCYDEENYHLIDQAIKARIDIIHGRYGNGVGVALKQCLEAMLHYDIQKRIGIDQLALLVNFQMKLYHQRIATQSHPTLSSIRYPSKPSNIVGINGPPLPHILTNHGQLINGSFTHIINSNPHALINPNHINFPHQTNTLQSSELEPLHPNLLHSQLQITGMRPQGFTALKSDRGMVSQTGNINSELRSLQKPMRPFEEMKYNEFEGKNDQKTQPLYSDKSTKLGGNDKSSQKYSYPKSLYSKQVQSIENIDSRKSPMRKSKDNTSTKEESLEERVERILRMSKDIQ